METQPLWEMDAREQGWLEGLYFARIQEFYIYRAAERGPWYLSQDDANAIALHTKSKATVPRLISVHGIAAVDLERNAVQLASEVSPPVSEFPVPTAEQIRAGLWATLRQYCWGIPAGTYVKIIKYTIARSGAYCEVQPQGMADVHKIRVAALEYLEMGEEFQVDQSQGTVHARNYFNSPSVQLSSEPCAAR